MAVCLDGSNSFADRIEQRVRIKQVIGMTQEVGETPARGLNRLCLANPAQLFLDARSRRGEQIGSLEFGQGRDLSFSEATVGLLEDGPAQRLGQFVLPGFGPAHLVDRLGEELHHVEPCVDDPVGSRVSKRILTGG
jgi:hypothetical protein